MLIKRKEEMADLFKYELTSEPSPLFKADMLRKATIVLSKESNPQIFHLMKS